MKKLRAIDLCCAVGGWACAARGLPIEFVAVADIEADALETWKLNHSGRHPKCEMIGQAIPIYVGRAILKAIVAEWQSKPRRR